MRHSPIASNLSVSLNHHWFHLALAMLEAFGASTSFFFCLPPTLSVQQQQQQWQMDACRHKSGPTTIRINSFCQRHSQTEWILNSSGQRNRNVGTNYGPALQNRRRSWWLMFHWRLPGRATMLLGMMMTMMTPKESSLILSFGLSSGIHENRTERMKTLWVVCLAEWVSVIQ